MDGFIKHFNWDNKNIKNKIYPVRVKKRSMIDTNYNWKENNSELVSIHNKNSSNNNNLDEYYPKEFKYNNLSSTLDSDSLKTHTRNFQRMRNNSMDAKITRIKNNGIKDDIKSLINNEKPTNIEGK